MVIIDRTQLMALFERIQTNSLDSVLELWRQIRGKISPLCEDCAVERILGRRCCCMCLESALSETSLCVDLNDFDDVRVRTTISSLKSHRTLDCAMCTHGADT